MTGFQGQDDKGRVVEDLTPETLRVLLSQTDGYVVVHDLSSAGPRRAEARRRDGGGWRVEVHGEPVGPRRVATAPNTDAAFDLLRSWAAGDGWWRDAFSWKRVEA